MLRSSMAADVELAARATLGDPEAFETLWERHETATRLASLRLVAPPQAERLVAETRSCLERRVATAPVRASFRFLLYDRLRTTAVRASPVAPISTGRRGALCEAFEKTPTLRAFRDLDARVQDVLWYTGIEPDRDAARYLGMDPDDIPDRAREAQSAFRTSWLSTLIADREEMPACQDHVTRLLEDQVGVVRIYGARRGSHLCLTCSIIDAEQAHAHQHFMTLARSLLSTEMVRAQA